MRRLASVNEYNLVGIAVTLILGLILLVLFPISNRHLGDLFTRLTSILSHSVRVSALRKKLLLPGSFRGVNTETAQQAEEYMTSHSVKLATGSCCTVFRQYLSKYNPLLYLPLATTEEKKFNILHPSVLFKWVVILLGAFTGWFCVSVLIYVYQTLYTGDTLEDQFFLSVAVAVAGAIAAQPIILLIIWGFYAVYLRVLRKFFKVSEARVKSEPAVSLNRSRSGIFQNQSVIIDVQHSLNSTSRKGFLAEPPRSDTSRVPLELPGDSPHRAASPANSNDDKAVAIGEDLKMYIEGERKNDGGFLEKFTVVCCILIISMGLFSGFACFALSSTYANVLFIGFCLETAADLLVLRLFICIVFTFFSSCAGKCCGPKEPVDPANVNFITRRELTTQNQQFTEISKLMQSPAGKVLTQTGPFLVQDESNIGGPGSINLDKSQQDPDKIEEDEKKWAELNAAANSFEDFNKVLIRKIYMTYDPVTSDALIKKWRDSNTTEELKEKTPEADVWNEAQEIAEIEGSQKKEIMEKNRLFSGKGDYRKSPEETRINDKIIEDSKEDHFEEVRKSMDMSFTEPPNIGEGIEIMERNEKAKTGVLNNIGIKGQMNPKLQSHKKFDAELIIDNIDELAITPEIDIKSPKMFSLEMINSQPQGTSSMLPLKDPVRTYAGQGAVQDKDAPVESEANIPTYKEDDMLDLLKIMVEPSAKGGDNKVPEEIKLEKNRTEVLKESVKGSTSKDEVKHLQKAAKESTVKVRSPDKAKAVIAAKEFSSVGSSGEKPGKVAKDKPTKAASQYGTSKSGKKESKKTLKEKRSPAKAEIDAVSKQEKSGIAEESKGVSTKMVEKEKAKAEGLLFEEVELAGGEKSSVKAKAEGGSSKVAWEKAVDKSKVEGGSSKLALEKAVDKPKVEGEPSKVAWEKAAGKSKVESESSKIVGEKSASKLKSEVESSKVVGMAVGDKAASKPKAEVDSSKAAELVAGEKTMDKLSKTKVQGSSAKVAEPIEEEKRVGKSKAEDASSKITTGEKATVKSKTETTPSKVAGDKTSTKSKAEKVSSKPAKSAIEGESASTKMSKAKAVEKASKHHAEVVEFSPSEASPPKATLAKANESPELKDVEVIHAEPDSCFAPHTEDAPKVVVAFDKEKVVKASNSPDPVVKSSHKTAKMAPISNKVVPGSKVERKNQAELDKKLPEVKGLPVHLEKTKAETQVKQGHTNLDDASPEVSKGSEVMEFQAEEEKGEMATTVKPKKKTETSKPHKESRKATVVSSEIQTDLRNTPAFKKKEPTAFTAASGVSAVEIESPVKKTDNWTEKKKLLREQVFDLADVLDKKIAEASKKRAKRKLKSQLVKKYEGRPKKDQIPTVADNKDLPDEDNKHSDSDEIDAGAVQFKDNFVLSDGGGPLAEEDVIYYPKEDLTNYSKNKGLNKMNARPIKRADEFQSDTDLFAHIEQSLLQPYNLSPRVYESDQDERLGEIAEDRLENDPTENPKRPAKKTKRNAPLPKKMTQTARQFQRPLIKKSVSQDLARRKKSPRRKPRPEFNIPVVKRYPQQISPQKPFDSPYSELLYKRYKEYQPDEADKIGIEANVPAKERLNELANVYGKQKKSPRKHNKKGGKKMGVSPEEAFMRRPPLMEPREYLGEEDKGDALEMTGKHGWVETKVEEFEPSDHV